MKSGAVTVPSSGESCANFAAALNAGAALFNDTPAETLPGKPDVVLRKWTASESYPVLEKSLFRRARNFPVSPCLNRTK